MLIEIFYKNLLVSVENAYIFKNAAGDKCFGTKFREK